MDQDIKDLVVSPAVSIMMTIAIPFSFLMAVGWTLWEKWKKLEPFFMRFVR